MVKGQTNFLINFKRADIVSVNNCDLIKLNSWVTQAEIMVAQSKGNV